MQTALKECLIYSVPFGAAMLGMVAIIRVVLQAKGLL